MSTFVARSCPAPSAWRFRSWMGRRRCRTRPWPGLLNNMVLGLCSMARAGGFSGVGLLCPLRLYMALGSHRTLSPPPHGRVVVLSNSAPDGFYRVLRATTVINRHKLLSRRVGDGQDERRSSKASQSHRGEIYGRALPALTHVVRTRSWQADGTKQFFQRPRDPGVPYPRAPIF